MKKNKYMAEIKINDTISYFTYTSQNMKTAKKELEDFFMTTQNTKIKIKLYEIAELLLAMVLVGFGGRTCCV